MGIDDNPLLTELEGECFNALYQIPKKEFNLSGKKVAFLTGIVGQTKTSNQRYFSSWKANPCLGYSPPGTLYIFNVQQKSETGSYDAAIVYWSKKLLTKEEVVKRLKNIK